MQRFLFPEWTNTIRPHLLLGKVMGGLYVVVLVTFGLSPKTTDVGYAPKQPVEFSHALHAGSLGLDCRYCHSTVERTGFAAIPANQTCMNCHKNIKTESPLLRPVREAAASNKSVEWVKVHKLPDYAYFNHSAHVTRGVGCVSCHGRIDHMDRVYQHEPLSMGWCLDCHRNPDQHLRIDGTAPTRMDWTQTAAPADIKKWREDRNIHPSTDCSTCHR